MGKKVKQKRKREKKASEAEVPEKITKSGSVLESRKFFIKDINRLLLTSSFVLIKGSISCGKTYCAREVAKELNLPVHTFHVNEDLDAKTLFGTYKCTNIPGEFIWTPTSFAKCLREECLILFEDLDMGSSDLISVVFHLCEKREYTLHTGERCQLHPKCRLLATVMSGRESALGVVREYPFYVELPPFSMAELDYICSIIFSRISDVKNKILHIFNDVCREVSSNCPMERQLNSKDLFRLCKRLNQFSDFADNILIFNEISDLFLMHLTDAKCRQKIAGVISGHLSITESQVNFLYNVRKPDIRLENDLLTIGNIHFRRKAHNARQISFALTRDCSQLMERISKCVDQREAVLLSGETGVGKTSVVQLLASYCGVSLKVVNFSEDSDFSDFIGGYKPTHMLNIVRPIADQYFDIFRKTFSGTKNSKFLSRMEVFLAQERIEDFLKLVIKSGSRAAKSKLSLEWANLVVCASRLLHYVQSSSCAFPFAFIAGVVTRATESGDWLLIDELNLAPPECLDAIMQIIDSYSSRVHPEFRLFACMNPGTDVGKRCLPNGVRSKFTEFFVAEPADRSELAVIVQKYLPHIESSVCDAIVNFYQEVHKVFAGKYSLRTLCRALDIVKGHSAIKIHRQNESLQLAFKISFSSNLDNEEQSKLALLLGKFFGKSTNVLKQPLSARDKGYISVEGHFIKRGNAVPDEDPRFIFTPTVRSNLSFLACVVANGQFPILLEGETSAGKTSIVHYLGKVTGNVVHRINNHEHTDVQEYIGSYAPNASGHIEFVEGVLLKAVRNGDWIILDELNLAPSIVLEALNRLLDDNREIHVPELNMTVAAHPQFRLFATQNPAGSYLGRKRLSRAFLNRFVIIKYDHLPFGELPKIVQGRCDISPSLAEKMVEVLVKLKSRRSSNGIFAFSNGLMTLRDLFRWGYRVAKTDAENFDWRQVALDQGYFVLASRCRSADDEKAVVDVLQKCLKRKVNAAELFSATSKYMSQEVVARAESKNILLSASMRRMLVLCAEAWRYNEPVLLVGETGCGKTTVAQLLNAMFSINCHERTETADFLGSVRPTSDGKFQWADGIVVQAMRAGEKLLVDEISLAPDSVLERLNSLLESDRCIMLTDGVQEPETIAADEQFQIIATMNPGDDHGKKELSKALRNRFLEIWCNAEHSQEEMQTIIQRRIKSEMGDLIDAEVLSKVSACIVGFFCYFQAHHGHLFKTTFSIRDLISVCELFISCCRSKVSISESIIHSMSACLFDAFGVLPCRISFNRDTLLDDCVRKLKAMLLDSQICDDADTPELMTDASFSCEFSEHGLQVGHFLIERGPLEPNPSVTFAFDAPTARQNLLRVARGLASTKPIMLEGSPGAGKSSLIMAIATATGNPLYRLNLSEQTDLHDLFGSDVPIVDVNGRTSFVWKDGPVLKAIKSGAWILLDEMNLASQSVLEGLNSCFDFRKTLYISELRKTFTIEATRSRFFACQNPRSQGGDRKALPKSFLNRFTSIYVIEMSSEDFKFILCQLHGEKLPLDLIHKMIMVNKRVAALGLINGGPFEFNMRDLLRWANAIEQFGVKFGFELIYISRVRDVEDTMKLRKIFNDTFPNDHPFFCLNTDKSPLIGKLMESLAQNVVLSNDDYTFFDEIIFAHGISTLQRVMFRLTKLLACVELNWLALLVGDFSDSLPSTLNVLATLAGKELRVLRLTSETDSLELLGSYEQITEYFDFDKEKMALTEIVHQHCAGDEKRIFSGHISNCLNLNELYALAQEIAVVQPIGELTELIGRLSGATNARFKWIDSNFVKAYQNGHWILIQDVNCCSCAVLDCLNSCLEDGGELVIPERFGEEIVRRHPDFRVFFTMNPTNGPLSRAMRNRSVEIFAGMDKFWSLTDLEQSSLLARFFELNSAVQPDAPGERKQLVVEKADATVINWLFFSSLGCSLTQVAASDDNSTGFWGRIERFLSELLSRIDWNALNKHLATMKPDFTSSLIQFGVCEPFSSEAHFRLCLEGLPPNAEAVLKMEVDSSVTDGHSNSSDIFLLLSKICEFFSTLDELISGKMKKVRAGRVYYGLLTMKAICSLPWINETAKRAFCFLEFLNTNVDFVSEDYSKNSFSFLRSSFLSIMADNYWSMFGYSSTPTWFQLKDSTRPLADLNQLRAVLWKLTFSRNFLLNEVNNQMKLAGEWFHSRTVVECGSGVCSTHDLLNFIRSSLELLTALTPPPDSVDISVQLAAELGGREIVGGNGTMREKLRIVSIYFQALKKFLYATTRHCDETFFDNLTFPILRLLWKSTSKPSTDYVSTNDDYVIVIDDDDNDVDGKDTPLVNLSLSAVYRPAFKRFCQLVGFLQEFTALASTFNSSVLQSEMVTMLSDADGDALPSAALVRISSQIRSFIKSATFFRRKLLEQYIGFPDVALTYSAVVDLLLLAIQSVLDRFLAMQQRRHATRELKFPEANFELCYPNGNECLTPLDDFFAWMLSEHSTLPLKFQRDVVHYQLGHGVYARGVIDWIYEQWRHRFECIAKKETKWFEYRKTGRDEKYDEIPDEDRVEFDYYFPDYSDATPEDEDSNESGSAAEQRLKRRFVADNNMINDGMVVEMLQMIADGNEGAKIGKESVFDDTEKIYFAIMRLFSDLELPIDEERNRLLNYSHLTQLAKTSRFLNAKCSTDGYAKQSLSTAKSGKAILNVYMESDYREVRRGVSALRVLECRVQAIHDEFPENQILAAILDSITKFLAVPSTQPLMKLTSMLEKVLMQADEWQQLADRAHSIREELLNLQHILVDWRQLEVLSWSTLIERVERDCAEAALISAFPLFEALNQRLLAESDEGGVENKLLLMLVEWIQNASMVDFPQRLFSGELLARFVEIKLGQCGGSKSTAISSLPCRIRLVVAYFGIFRAEITERYASEKQDVTEKLRNFVELFRYNDLNLWSVRQSTQKVHAQLFRIVKRLKECCRQSISDVLFDKPLSNTSSGVITFDFTNHSQISSIVAQHSVEERFYNITDRLNSILSVAVDVEPLTDAAEASDEYLSILQTQIVYNAATDEENEKLQGRALFERQKRFAFLIRSLFEFGWSSRRGLEVNSEALTIAALSEVDFDGIFAVKSEKTDIGDQMRSAVAIRNVVLRKHAGVRLNQNEHLKRQLPMSMFSHIRGLTEFGLFWAVKAATHLSKHFSIYIVDLEQLHNDFDVIIDNYKTGHHSLNRAEIGSTIETSIMQLKKIWRILDVVKGVLNACPEGDDLNGADCDWTFASSTEVDMSGADSPLASLTKSSSIYRVLEETVNTAHALFEQCLQSSVVLKGSIIRLWKTDQLVSFRETIEPPLLQLQSEHIPLLSKYFCAESDSLSELCKSILNGLSNLPSFSACDDNIALTANLAFDDSIMSVSLKIQQAFKGLAVRAELTDDVAVSSTKLLDRIKRIIEYVCGLDINLMVDILSSIRNLLVDPSSQSIASIDDLFNAKHLSAGVAHFLRCILAHSALFLQHFSRCYVSFEAVACHVITNGFVNAIPQPDKGVGDGKAKENGAADGDACGMGDADPGGDTSDARDIGSELDNMGQVEGLKDENESQNKPQENGSAENEQQQPVEMEDDFMGELEGLDDAERDERNNDDDDNGEDDAAAEDNIDWEKGDVEEPDEKQLDPELWEKPTDQEPVEAADDGTDAANQETGEMTAAAPESTVDANEDANDEGNDELNGVNEKETELNDDPEELGGVSAEKVVIDEEAGSETNSNEDDEKEDNSNFDMDGLDISENEEEDVKGKDVDNDDDTQNATDIEEDADKEGENEEKDEGKEADEDRAATGYEKTDDAAENEKGQGDNTEPTAADENKPSPNDDENRMEVDPGNGTEEENTCPILKGDQKKQPSDRKLEDEKTANSAEKEGKSRKDLADNEDNDVEIIEGLEASSDKDDDGMDEIGSGDRLAADSSKKDEIKHVIQQSSMEEAVKTKRLLDKLNQIAKSSALEQEELLKSLEDQNEGENDEETLEFSRYEGTTSMKDMIVISRELVHAQKSLSSLDNKLEEELNSDGTSVDRRIVERAMEIRWSIISNSVSQLSSLLAENLRMIIEPTIASRLQGDYRTGKRLNIRRLISYVASDYRKDRIWMRRTKKVKRNYQICIAVDDSASVKDNAMSTIICHSLCLIEKALMQLEIGRLMICKFGSTVKVLSDFSSTPNNELGARLMSELTFAQERTNLVNLLGVVNEKFTEARRFHASAEQMLIVLSDGRGVLADGLERIRAAQHQLETQQITVLFLIIDNGKRSIMDVKVAMFEKDGGVRLVSYMEQFPFPFYAIINGLQMLPATLASAIQQWFEFTLR